eukprot:741251-Rhodomonas_salina.1
MRGEHSTPQHACESAKPPDHRRERIKGGEGRRERIEGQHAVSGRSNGSTFKGIEERLCREMGRRRRRVQEEEGVTGSGGRRLRE